MINPNNIKQKESYNLLKNEFRMKIVIPVRGLNKEHVKKTLMTLYKKDINFRWIKIKEILEKIKK